MSTVGELACSYAALILHEEDVAITAENITTLVKAANLSVESFWAVLFARLLKAKNVDDLIMCAGSGGGGAVAAPTTAATGAGISDADAPPAEDNRKEEKEESEEEDMSMFSLFD